MNIDEKIVKLATDYVDKYDIEDATGTSLATLVAIKLKQFCSALSPQILPANLKLDKRSSFA